MTLVTLVRLTLLELWRQRQGILPVLVLLLLTTMALLPVPEISANGEALRIRAQDVAGGAFRVLQFFGVFLGLLVGAGLVAGEVERGTILLLATKPVPRWQLLLGKTLGAFLFILASFAAWGAVLALLVGFRLSVSDVLPTFGGTLVGALVAWLFAAIAICGSTRLPTMGAMGTGLLVWLLGSSAPNLIRLKEMAGYEWVGRVSEVVATVVPVGRLDALSGALAFGPPPPAQDWLYLAAIPAWLVVAGLLFQRRNLS